MRVTRVIIPSRLGLARTKQVSISLRTANHAPNHSASELLTSRLPSTSTRARLLTLFNFDLPARDENMGAVDAVRSVRLGVDPNFALCQSDLADLC